MAPLVSGILAELGSFLRPGIRTRDIESHAVELLRAADLAPRMLGFNGYPSAIAVSVDDEVLHGLPSDRILREGQLVKIQIGGRTRQGTADQGWTFALGAVDDEKRRLRDVGIQALRDAIAAIRAGSRTGDVGAAIQTPVEAAGFSVIRDYVGYAIGSRPMQDPQLPCFGRRGTGSRLPEGVLLHVHVIAAAGSWEVATSADRWTVMTVDHRPAVLLTAVVRARADGCDVLTPLLA